MSRFSRDALARPEMMRKYQVVNVGLSVETERATAGRSLPWHPRFGSRVLVCGWAGVGLEQCDTATYGQPVVGEAVCEFLA